MKFSTLLLFVMWPVTVWLLVSLLGCLRRLWFPAKNIYGVVGRVSAELYWKRYVIKFVVAFVFTAYLQGWITL